MIDSNECDHYFEIGMGEDRCMYCRIYWDPRVELRNALEGVKSGESDRKAIRALVRDGFAQWKFGYRPTLTREGRAKLIELKDEIGSGT